MRSIGQRLTNKYPMDPATVLRRGTDQRTGRVDKRSNRGECAVRGPTIRERCSPYSGSPANLAHLHAFAKRDRSWQSLPMGAYLTHGSAGFVSGNVPQRRLG